MPSLPQLALRYLAGLLVLTFAYSALTRLVGLPYQPAIGVVFSSIPAVYIAYFARQTATRALTLRDWGLIWGLCVSVLAAIQVIIPAIVVAEIRLAMSNPAALQIVLITLVSSAAMIALFLWIGSKIQR